MKHMIFCLAALACASGAPAFAAPKPDLLLIMPDQMRGDCLSCLGHPVVRTPHLDRLATQGVLFRRAYATVPSCIPARHALLTGLYPQTSGVVGFKARPITSPTLPQSLAAAGYKTVLVGRHMHQVPATEPYGFQEQILGSTYIAQDDYDRALQAAVPDSGGIRQLVASLGLTFNGWQAKPWPLAEDWHPTAWIVRQAASVLSRTSPDQPLFLTASFYAPHPPLFPPRKQFDACRQADLPDPARGRWVDWKALSPKGDKTGHRVRLEGDPLRNAQAGYFGLIQHLDEQLGPLIQSFQERSGKTGRPWVIVFTSDHGEMLGDHGYFRKCEPYEGAANIPFLIAASPSLGFRAGRQSLQPVCLEDIMPTLLDLAGAKPPALLDGISLLPALREDRASVRPWLHFEHAPCYSREQAFHALVDQRYKYVWRPTDGTEQLFDLAADPKEERDLARDDAAIALLQRWRSRMVARLAGRPEGFSDRLNLIPGRPYPPLQQPAPAAPDAP